jgi:uncharacterized protein (DUF427 family)
MADSEDVLLLHEPARYPVAYFPLADVRPGVLISESRHTRHRDLGETEWFTVSIGDQRAAHGAWQHTDLADYASELRGRVAFAWRAMDAFYEEDDRIVGHASDAYHRIDIRQSSRHLVVKDGARVIADTSRPVVLYESGFAPRWYVPRQACRVDRTAASACSIARTGVAPIPALSSTTGRSPGCKVKVKLPRGELTSRACPIRTWSRR